ncbi:hypothetical protein RQP46_010701 [Phenoliferia psychrophenolica]
MNTNTAETEKLKGNAAFARQDFALAVRHYSIAIETHVDHGNVPYYTNRALAYLKLENRRCRLHLTSALRIDETSSKAYWHRATARRHRGPAFLRDSLADYISYRDLSVEKTAAATALCLAAISEIEAILLRNEAPLTTATSVLEPVNVSLLGGSVGGPMGPLLDKIYASYAELNGLWKEHESEIVTFWHGGMEINSKEGKLKLFLATYEAMGYSELNPAVLAKGINLLDFISARATTSPADFAFSLDLVRAQLSRAQAGLSGPSLQQRHSTYISMLPSEYGLVKAVNWSVRDEVKARQKSFDRGDACEREDGEAMLKRQVDYYAIALAVVKGLIESGDGKVCEEVVEEHRRRQKSKVYAGKPTYSIELVEENVRSAKAYAEDHLDFLRTDPDYVSERILDRLLPLLPSPLNRNETDAKGADEAVEMFIQGYARKTLWTDALSVIDELKAIQPALGPGRVLPKAYRQRMSLLRKLVAAFVNLTHKELTASVERSFSTSTSLQTRHRPAGNNFHHFLHAMAELSGSAKDRTLAASQNLLGSALKAFMQLHPLHEPTETWQMSAGLGMFADLFKLQPKLKMRLSATLVQGLGEYNEAIELREMLVDSHRPHFNGLPEKSIFLSELGSVWSKIERCWTTSVPTSLVGKVIRDKKDADLEVVWARLETGAHRELKYTIDELFSNLIAPKSKRHRSTTTTTTASVLDSPSSGSESETPSSTSSAAPKSDHRPLIAPPVRAPVAPSAPAQKPRRTRLVVPEPAPGPSSSSFSTRPSAPVTLVRPSSPEPAATAPKTKKSKTRPERPVTATKVNSRDSSSGSGSGEEEERRTPEEEAEAKVVFRVSQRVYSTFEQYLSSSVKRTGVAWKDFLTAMQAIGFECINSEGSKVKFRTNGLLKDRSSVTFAVDKCHPDTSHSKDNVSRIGWRLRRHYTLHMDLFAML